MTNAGQIHHLRRHVRHGILAQSIGGGGGNGGSSLGGKRLRRHEGQASPPASPRPCDRIGNRRRAARSPRLDQSIGGGGGAPAACQSCRARGWRRWLNSWTAICHFNGRLAQSCRFGAAADPDWILRPKFPALRRQPCILACWRNRSAAAAEIPAFRAGSATGDGSSTEHRRWLLGGAAARPTAVEVDQLRGGTDQARLCPTAFTRSRSAAAAAVAASPLRSAHGLSTLDAACKVSMVGGGGLGVGGNGGTGHPVEQCRYHLERRWRSAVSQFSVTLAQS